MDILLKLNDYVKNENNIVINFPDLSSKYYPAMHKINFNEIMKDLDPIKSKQPSISFLAEKYNVSYTTMIRYVKNYLGFSYRFANPINKKKFSKENSLQMTSYLMKLSSIFLNKCELIFVDESSFNSQKRIKKRWLMKGTNSNIPDNGKITSVHLTVASSNTKVLYHELITSNNNSENFVIFLKNLLISIKNDRKIIHN